MSKNSELVGVWNGADHIFDNGPDRRCVIGTIRAMDKTVVTIRGYASEAEISEGVTYRFYGHYRVHPKFGRQFNFNSFIEETPVDEDSVIAYLAQCRKPEHGSISKRVAALLFEKYGLDSIDQLIQDPVAAAEGIAQWGAEKAAIASEYLRAQDGTRRCKLDLIRLFDGRRFPKKTAVRAIREFGVEAGKEIRKDPYILMSFPGIGFKGADKLYCDLARESAKTDVEYQKKLADIRRQGFCVVHFVNTESMQSGSTWIIEGVAKASVKRLISGAMANPEEAIEWACGKGLLVRKDGHVASARKALHELEIAEFVSSSDGCAEWPSVETIASFAPADKPLSEHQLDGIFAATRKRVGCLQGSPGVGKTFCVAAIVKAIIREHGRDSIAVAAPTGKAGVRVTQSLAANDVDIQASTIHRLLGVSAQGGDDGWQFVHNEQSPLPFKFIITDESSMADIDLAAALVRACTSNTHILLVGDSNQLAPVGHGRPFFDLQSCIPTGHLTEIRRNSGQIVKACAQIRDSSSISFSREIDLPQENLVLVQADEEDQVAAMESMIQKIAAQHEHDWIEDLQIVTGKNDGSPIARKPLNRVLQKLFNSGGYHVHGNPFRVGDKIVCLKNGTYPDAEEPSEEHFVANGELGRVTDLQPGRMQVQLSDPYRSIRIFHYPVQENESEVADSEDSSRGAVGDWDLGYALSVHRSQGSQWKHVIVMADSKGGLVQNRAWIYTAISRAEVATWVIGHRNVVNQMLKRDGISGRKTFLAERIRSIRLSREVDYSLLFSEV